MIFDSHNHIGFRHGNVGQNAEEMIRQMDEAGVDRAVVFSFIEKTDNNYVSEMVKKFHDRLVGYALVNSFDSDADQQFLHAIFDLGLRGLKMDTPRRAFSLNDFDLLDPILSICNSYHLPVIAYGANDNPFTHPYKFGEMAVRYPNANFILAHMGILFATGQAIEMAKTHRNIYIETSNVNASAIRDAVKKAGAEKVLFGTDSPFSFFKITKLTVEMSVTTSRELDLVNGENMQRILSEITLQTIF